MVGAGLLTRITATIPYVEIAWFMIFIGIGYGLTGPSASIVIQSSVPLADLAAASATGTFMSQLGGAVGVAVAGSIFTNLYQQDLNTLYRDFGLGSPPPGATDLSGSDIAKLGDPATLAFQEAYSYGLAGTMWAVLGFTLGQMLCTWALVEVPLRGKHAKGKGKAKESPPAAVAPPATTPLGGEANGTTTAQLNAPPPAPEQPK